MDNLEIAKLRHLLSKTAQSISIVSQKNDRRVPRIIASTISSFQCLSIPKVSQSFPIGAISLIQDGRFRSNLDLNSELKVFVLSASQSEFAHFFSTSNLYEKVTQLELSDQLKRVKKECLFEFTGKNLHEYLVGESSLITFEMQKFIGSNSQFPLIYQNRNYWDHL